MDKRLLVALVVVLVAANVDAKKKKKAPIPVDEGDPFSDQGHFHDGKHDAKYDQDAFLGEDQAQLMHGLSTKETKKKLKVIFSKIDVDQDKKISRKELLEWIVDNMKKHVAKTTNERFGDLDKNKDGKVSWEEYVDVELKHAQDSTEDGKKLHEEQIARDKKKFNMADTDGDNALTKDELGIFLHPEESARMTSLLVEENIESMDKDGDKLIDFEEYVGLTGDDTADKETRDSLRETFNNELDKNKDGKLDKDEVKDWILPGGDSDPATGEANHLMKEADTNKDNYLSLKEVLENNELFAGGRATAYGELLKNDEL